MLGKQTYSTVAENVVVYGNVKVDGLNIAYREAGCPEAPEVVFLHTFPSSSHQFRGLLPDLGNRFHMLAPDLPGCGNSEMPDPEVYDYTFEKMTDIVEAFLEKMGFETYGLYLHGHGGPIGFRVLERHPERVQWLIIQNANAYEVGLTPIWESVRAMWKSRTEETEKALAGLFDEEGIKRTYLHGVQRADLVSPDSWHSDFGFLEQPNARRVQLDLLYDSRKNLDLYASWQNVLRQRQPKTLIFWGQNDMFFNREGGEAYLRDLPNAEMHRLDSGHFAVEDNAEKIYGTMKRFFQAHVATKERGNPRPALS